MNRHKGTRTRTRRHGSAPFGRIRILLGLGRSHPAGRILSTAVATTLAIVLVVAVGPATAGDDGVTPDSGTSETTPAGTGPGDQDTPEVGADSPAGDAESDAPTSGPDDADDDETGDPAEGDPADDQPTGGDTRTPTPRTLALSGSTSVAAVPSPGAGEAVIHVKVGSDRTGNGATAVSSLPGVKLGLWKDSNGSLGSRVNDAWGTCVSDAGGDCSFVVPNTGTGGTNRDDRFWVQQVDAGTTGTPAGYFASTVLGTATSSNDYRFRTGSQLRAGNTYDSGNQFMGDSSGVTESSGIWQVSRNNPNLPAKCGLDVALVLDLSTSIGGNIGNLKAAADGFVDALTGTPSRIATFSFGSASPASGTSNTPSLMSVSSSGAAVKATYAGWTIGTNYTNWDQALKAVADAAPHYDAVVVITDGNPTVWGTSPDNTVDTTLREVEYGIFSANLVKHENTRVIAFGVGDGVSSAASGLNLRAISGPTKFNGSNAVSADYYQVADFTVAGQALRTLALGTCEGSLTVVKQVVPEGNTGENITGAQTAGGWQMIATPVAPVTLNGPAGQSTDGATGAVNYKLDFPAGTTTGSVTVNETQQTDYVVVTQSGKNAVCKNVATGANLPVTNAGGAGNPGFTVSVSNAAPVSCTIYNRHTPLADLAVAKTWRINGTTYANGDQPEGISAQLKVSEPGQTTPVDKSWSQVYGGYVKGSKARITETVTAPGCTVDSQKVTTVNGSTVDVSLGSYFEAMLALDHNTYGLTNTLTCPVKLQVKKVDESGNPLGGASFTFTPSPVTGTGSLVVTDNGAGDADPASGIVLVDPARPGSYTVEETAAPAGYALPRTRAQVVAATTPGATRTLTFVDRLLWAAPTVTKTVDARYDATYAWSIAKTVKNGSDGTPGSSAQQEIAAGGSALFGYDVTVTQGAQTRSNFRASGVVTVTNPNNGTMRVTLEDQLSGATCTFPGVTDLDAGTPGKQVDLAKGANAFGYSCVYAGTPADQDGGSNVATVTWSRATYPQTQAHVDSISPGNGTASVTQPFSFSEAASTNKTITVTDDKHVFSPAWTITWSAAGTTSSKSYTWTTAGVPGTCDGRQTNTARIVETGQTAATTAVVCVGKDLDVTKNVVAGLTRTYLWDITKTADVPTLTTLDDGSVTADYSVRVQAKGFDDTNWLMTGAITVKNPNLWEAVTLTGVQDVYEGTTCTITDAAGNLTLGAGKTRTYHYSCTFGSKPPYAGTNTATVTWDKAAAHTPTGTASGTKAVTEAMWTESPVNKTVSVYDDWTKPGEQHLVTGPITWTEDYDETFDYSVELTGVAGGTCADFTNRAWIKGAGDGVLDEDTAQVTACHPVGLSVSKTAEGDFTRTYEWGIEKFIDGDQSSQTVHVDAYDHEFAYKVKVTPGAAVDSAWKVSGTITVTNDNTDADIEPVDLTGVDDSPEVGADATCVYREAGTTTPVSFPIELESGEDVDIDYVCTLESQPTKPYAGSNTATATWGADGSASSEPVEVEWNAPTEVDESVEVFDDKVDQSPAVKLGTVAWNEAGTPSVFDYTKELSVAESTAGRCGPEFVNTAWLGGDGSEPTDRSDTATAVICPNAGTWTVAKVNVDGDGPVPTDSDVTYRLSAHKTGGVNPKDVVLLDDLSDLVPHLTGDPVFVEPAGTSVEYDGSTHVLTWTIDELGAVDRTLEFTVHVAADAYGVDLPNLVTSPGSENCPEAGSVVAGCRTDNDTAHFTLDKSSDAGGQVLPPYLGEPGTVITYTLRVHNDSDAPINPTTLPGAQVVDDLSAVLDDASFVAGSIDPADQAVLDGTTLTWTLPVIAPGADAVLTYQVRVDAEEWDQTLTNTATPGEGGDCVEDGECTTTTVTPPFTQVSVVKTDLETGDPLGGAQFALFKGDTASEGNQIATATSDEATGVAVFDVLLQPGDFTIVETKAPEGYDLPINGADTIHLTIDQPGAEGTNFVENGVMEPITFADPATGEIATLPKAQFERDPLTNAWVASDGQVEFGDEIRYVVDVESTGTRQFHDVTLTDYVPGHNPADVTTAPAGTKAELEEATVTCGGAISCTSEYDASSGLITWHLTETGQAEGVFDGAASGWVEFVVRMPDIPGTSPIQTPGTAFAGVLWNQAYLDWKQLDLVPVEDVPARLAVQGLVEPTMTDHHLDSNEVTAAASATLPPEVVEPPTVEPTVEPPSSSGLPNTGGPDAWLLVAGLVLLLGGGILLLSEWRRRRWS